jgi:hypothetical protein
MKNIIDKPKGRYIRKPIDLRELAPLLDRYRWNNEIPSSAETLRRVVIAGLQAVGLGAGLHD